MLQSCCSTSRSDLSKSTTSLASKTTWYGTLDSNDPIFLIDSDSQSDSDHEEESNSIDSFYERSFEAVEQLLDSESWCYRDSAIFSDRDDLSLTAVQADLEATDSFKRKNPPPIPVKPDRVVQQAQQNRIRGMAVLERVRSLEESARGSKELASCCSSLENLKSIVQRRQELSQAVSSVASITTKPGDESETSSQHSTSTINTVVEMHPAAGHADESESSPTRRKPTSKFSPAAFSPRLKRSDVGHNTSKLPHTPVVSFAAQPPEQTEQASASAASAASPLPKGWVKHIIGKLLGDIK